jgi:hypothetical protein
MKKQKRLPLLEWVNTMIYFEKLIKLSLSASKPLSSHLFFEQYYGFSLKLLTTFFSNEQSLKNKYMISPKEKEKQKRKWNVGWEV